ncbi:MAG: hypothetical protein HY280_05045 [Nitrospinae bacterium]|nr:hypothetical protein [Nitrospinota bacterium]
MRGAFFIVGRTLQIIGIGTVMIAALSFFTVPDMGQMFKTTIFGVIEFYVGNYIVTKTGDKVDGE